MSIGQFLAGAGNVGQGMDRAASRAQLLRMQQLAIQDANRNRAIEQRAAANSMDALGNPVEVPNYALEASGTPGTIAGGTGSERTLINHMRNNLPPDQFAIWYGQYRSGGNVNAATPAAGPSAVPTTPEPTPAPNPPPPKAGVAAPSSGSKFPIRPENAPFGLDAAFTAQDRSQPLYSDEEVRALVERANAGDEVARGLLAEAFPSWADRTGKAIRENTPLRLLGRAGRWVQDTVAGIAESATTPNVPGLRGPNTRGDSVMSGQPPGPPLPAGPTRERAASAGLATPGAEDKKPAASGKVKRPDAKPGPAVANMEAAAGATSSTGKGKSRPAATEATDTPSAFYAGDWQKISADRAQIDDIYQRRRARLYAQAEAALAYGESTRAQPYLEQMEQLDAAYATEATLLEGMAALTMFEFGNDPRALSQILSDRYLGGTPVDFQARTDGMYDLYIGNQPQGTYGKADVTDMVRQLIDETYRQSTTAAKAEYSMEAFKSQLATNAKLTEIEAQHLADRALAMVKGGINMQIAQVAGREFTIVNDPNTNTAILYAKDGSYVARLDLNSLEMLDTPAGEIPASPTISAVHPSQTPGLFLR